MPTLILARVLLKKASVINILSFMHTPKTTTTGCIWGSSLSHSLHLILNFVGLTFALSVFCYWSLSLALPGFAAPINKNQICSPHHCQYSQSSLRGPCKCIKPSNEHDWNYSSRFPLKTLLSIKLPKSDSQVNTIIEHDVINFKKNSAPLMSDMDKSGVQQIQSNHFSQAEPCG